MSARALLLISLDGQADLRHHDKSRLATKTPQSRDMSSSINPRLAREALLQGRSCKERFLIGIKSIFERRKKKQDGERSKRDLGLDSWDGFAWAERRQVDGQRAEKVWDSARKEWVVVPNLGLERSVSPCDMRRTVSEEDEETEIGRVEVEDSYDSFYAAPTSVGSPVETDYTRSISEQIDDIDATIRQSMIAASQSNATFGPETRKDSDPSIRPDLKATEDIVKSFQTNDSKTEDTAKLSRPSLTATKKHISLRRTAIWNAACISGRKGLDFWRLGSQRSQEAGSESDDGEEPLVVSSESKTASLPANPRKSDLDGLAKLIGSIDSERVNTVRHIWHKDTHEWTVERNAGTQTDEESV